MKKYVPLAGRAMIERASALVCCSTRPAFRRSASVQWRRTPAFRPCKRSACLRLLHPCRPRAHSRHRLPHHRCCCFLLSSGLCSRLNRFGRVVRCRLKYCSMLPILPILVRATCRGGCGTLAGHSQELEGFLISTKQNAYLCCVVNKASYLEGFPWQK